MHRSQSQLEGAEALHKSLAVAGLSQEEDCEMAHVPTQLLRLPQQSSNTAVGLSHHLLETLVPPQAT